ncbi:hypothetical protein AAZX31_05G227700 [Glycine max]
MGNPGLNNRDNGQQQRLGITEPISLGGPTEYDVIKTRELEKYLQDAGLYENQQEAVHSPGANIDTLCVGPRHASRDEDFFGDLHRMLSKMPEVTELHPVPDAHVPVMRFKFNGVYIDLLYAKLSLRDLDISQELILQNADEETVCSLNGCRVTDKVLLQNFCTTLRCMKFWAKHCGLFPNALPNMLVFRFFRVYTQWCWPNPVMLCAIEEGSVGLQIWDPRRYPNDRFHLMPIITPAYACMNSSYNVSSITLCIMTEEFQRGNEICEKNYLQIDISGENADDLRKWKGWVESHLRQHIYGMLQCHPHPGDSSDKSRPFHCSNFMALQRKQGVPVNDGGQFDIRLTVEEFKHSVNIYTLWIPGMDVHVPHVKHRNIPTFVFPGSVRPSHPSKLRVSGHAQAEKSQEGKMAVLGANDDRKRKQAEDSVDSLRNSKSMASLPPSSREVHEDENPISPASSCFVKSNDSEINSTSEQQSEKPDLKSSGECPGDRETNGSVTSNLQVNAALTATDTSSSKEAEKLAIEKIMCGPYDAQQVFSGEPDELEDDLEFRNQVKDFVAAKPIIPKKETTSATLLYSNGGSEELEVNLLIYHKYRTSAIIFHIYRLFLIAVIVC